MYPQISTSIGVDDVLALAKGAKKYYIGQTSGFPFSHQEMKIGKKSCVIPTTLESNVVQLHTFLYDQEQYDAPASVKEISNYIAQKTGLGDPGKDTETGKNIGAEGNNGGGQTGGKSEQPAAAPAQTEPADKESSEAAEESSESAEETIESSAAEETKERKPHPASSARRRTARVLLRQPLPITPVTAGFVSRARIVHQWTGHLQCPDCGRNQCRLRGAGSTWAKPEV
ncbi:MAG: hypothetical protein V8S58_06180 [Lachnospiraceae bacterium]